MPGTRHCPRGSSAGAASTWPPEWFRVATRSSPRSTLCTPPPAKWATPTGRRSSHFTTSSSASTPRRSSTSTGPSRVAELDGPEVALAAVDCLEDQLAAITPTHATRADAPSGPVSAVGRGVRQGHRAGGQHLRDRLPHQPPRPARVAPGSSVENPGQAAVPRRDGAHPVRSPRPPAIREAVSAPVSVTSGGGKAVRFGEARCRPKLAGQQAARAIRPERWSPSRVLFGGESHLRGR